MPQKPHKPRPVLIAMSVLAGYQVLVAGSYFADVVGPDIAGLLVLAGAAVQTGVQFYVQGQVTPVDDPTAEDETDEDGEGIIYDGGTPLLEDGDVAAPDEGEEAPEDAHTHGVEVVR